MFCMANEAVLIYELQSPIPFTVANGTGIEKGAVLKLTDPMTASAPTTSGSQIAGIAASEKIASDGKVKLGVYRQGIFKVSLSGSCNAGDPAIIDGISPNYFRTYDNLLELSGSAIAGIFFESGTDGETVLMELRPEVSAGST